jgi:hypothetical protein
VSSKDEIKKHPFFKDIDWQALAEKRNQPPINLVLIKNEIDSEMPKSNKDSLKFMDKDYDETNQDINRVVKYTFVRSPDVNVMKK